MKKTTEKPKAEGGCDRHELAKRRIARANAKLEGESASLRVHRSDWLEHDLFTCLDPL